mmetsp:Transcript_67142/g.197072  ORF Transcript_67142/g.197072 Transcript_67142/m.197072 type:complete len:210 (-) Transcript_67142:757-1386(-)
MLVISVRRSFTCTTVAPRERSRFEKTRCCALRSTRLKHSSTFMVSSVQGITESTSRPGSCTSTSSRRPTSLWTLQADFVMAAVATSLAGASEAGKSSAIMHRTEPPPSFSMFGTGAAMTVFTHDSSTVFCVASSESQPALEMASTDPWSPCSWMQLPAKFSICSRLMGTTTLPVRLRVSRTCWSSASSAMHSEQSTAKLVPTDISTFVW